LHNLTAIDYKYYSDIALESQAEHESSVNARCTTLKQTVLTTAATTLGHTKRIRNRKPRITAEMINKMTQRRKWKSVNFGEGRTRYRAPNNQVRRETDKAKETWWDGQCTGLEEMNNMGGTDLLYGRVTNLTQLPEIRR